MKHKIVILFLATLVFGNLANISWGQKYDFRKTKWGMAKQEVIKSESLKPFKNEKNAIIYKSNVLGKNVYIAYLFVQNKLVRTKYMLAEKHTNKNMFIDDYKDFKNILIKKYGQCIKVYQRRHYMEK